MTIEFLRRMDPDLPFYYYTSPKSRYYEGELPDFSIASKSKPSRPPQRELLGSTGHVTLTARGKGTLKTRFHKHPIDLPPPPGSSVVFEHSYASGGPSSLTGT